MISLLAYGLASPLGPAEIAAAALAAGLSRAERLQHGPVLGLGADAGHAVAHHVIADARPHAERCHELLQLARAELGPCRPDAVLLCRPLPDPLRWGPSGPPPLPADEVFALGHAAAAAALRRADDLISSRTCRRVLVTAVDSLVDADSLDWLHAADRLRGPEDPDGVVPGEAAACWLVGPADPAAAAQLSAGFATAGARSALDDGERWLRAADGAPGGTDWLDLTGEPWRARAWGALAHRAQRHATVTPADSWGDLGAACLLAAGAACLASGGRPAALWAMSDDGAAGVIGLR